jgi:hypothetical protein
LVLPKSRASANAAVTTISNKHPHSVYLIDFIVLSFLSNFL